MTFKTDLAKDMDEIFLENDEFSEDITYTPKGGSGKIIKAIVDEIDKIQSDVQGRENETETLRITINSDATLGIASPGYGDIILVNALTFKYNGRIEKTANSFLLEFVIITQTQAFGPNTKFQR